MFTEIPASSLVLMCSVVEQGVASGWSSLGIVSILSTHHVVHVFLHCLNCLLIVNFINLTYKMENKILYIIMVYNSKWL